MTRALVRSVILSGMNDVTQILADIEAGNPNSSNELLPIVYRELHRLAKARMAKERVGHTLQTTALVHEAYLRLVDVKQAQQWHSREHFFAAAAESMRRILVDQARSRQSEKRGGHLQRQSGVSRLADATPSSEDDRILAVHDALDELEKSSPRQCELVKLRFFVGMTLEEAAESLDVSIPTVKRDWVAAKVFIYRHAKPE